uniref:Sulfhydryl oxidase n=1 Tax=Piliocolobus tephrosceles TaxID=591936 RepID=A0A8C9GIE4_9PRIM
MKKTKMDIKQCYESSCNDKNKQNIYQNKDNTNSTKINKKIYPPDRVEIGRASWLILHTIAANYPNKPTEEEKQKYTSFFYAFSNLYPCHICKLDLLYTLKKHKFNCNNKIEFSKFIYNLHNKVNSDIVMTIIRLDEL